MDSQRYIEVCGEGSCIESANRFVAEVMIEVRATKKDPVLDEINDLWKAAIKSLRASGIAEAEIVEGGIDLFQPWYWIRKPGQAGTRKIILKVTEFERLHAALESLESLQDGNRRTLTVDLKQPEFDTDSPNRAKALSAAFEDAKIKAATLATKMNVVLGEAIWLAEGKTARRNSGFVGDEDWQGDGARFGASLGAIAMAADTGEGFVSSNPTREVWMSCRVRFAIHSRSEAADSAQGGD